MDLFSSVLFPILIFIILLGPLMFVHELGHFIAAKRAGIRVEEFGMGFPPRALTLFKRGETTYSLNWLPIGAFVKMTGEDGAAVVDPRSFGAQSKRWRVIVLLAGPVMNFLFAIPVLFLAYLLLYAQPVAAQYKVTVSPGSNAEKIGMRSGDIVLAANGVDATDYLLPKDTPATISKADLERLRRAPATETVLRQQASASIGKPFSVTVLREENGVKRPIEVSGVLPATADSKVPLGVSLEAQLVRSTRVALTVGEAFDQMTFDVGRALGAMVTIPLDVLRGRLAAEVARPVGPIGITQIGISLWQQGPFPFVQFAGLLSILIGLSNLLPIPALDGGRILFILIEWIRGRRIDPVREQWIHAVGMIFVLALAAVIALFDIIRPIRLP
jgi:regulator of sigma E protease